MYGEHLKFDLQLELPKLKMQQLVSDCMLDMKETVNKLVEESLKATHIKQMIHDEINHQIKTCIKYSIEEAIKNAVIDAFGYNNKEVQQGIQQIVKSFALKAINNLTGLVDNK